MAENENMDLDPNANNNNNQINIDQTNQVQNISYEIKNPSALLNRTKELMHQKKYKK